VQDELKRLSEIELSLQNEIDEKLKQVGRLGCGLKRRRVVWVCV